MIDSKQLVEMSLSWFRVFMAASLAVLLNSVQADNKIDATQILTAGLCAVLPVIIRFLDPMDKTYGIGHE